MASPVELAAAAVLTLVVLWAVNRAQSLVAALVDGRVDLLTWDDRMAELSGEEDAPTGDGDGRDASAGDADRSATTVASEEGRNDRP